MDYRLLILYLARLILPPVLARLKEEAKKTPSPVDDAIIEIGEILLTMFSTGRLADLIKKP